MPAAQSDVPARIGIDAHVLGKSVGGVERYVQKLVELAPSRCPRHSFFIFLTREAAKTFVASAPNVQVIELPFADPILQRSIYLPWAIRRYRLDLLQVQRVAPWASSKCRILLTIHDLVPVKQPAAYRGVRNMLVRQLTRGSIRRADLIVCPSQFVCDDIAKFYAGAHPVCRPFYNGVDMGAFSPASALLKTETVRTHGLERGFIYVPGAVEPRRNCDVVLLAIARLAPSARPLLVFTGPIRDRAYYANLLQRAAELGISDLIKHLGFVSDAELRALYSAATICIASSTEEGFNIPALEAIACGARLLCSDIPVHRELFSEVARFFLPSLAAALSTLIEQAMAGALPETSRSQRAACVARFSWEAMADRMATYYDQTLRAPRPASRGHLLHRGRHLTRDP